MSSTLPSWTPPTFRRTFHPAGWILAGFLALCWTASVAADTWQVIMPSRLPLVPWALEEVRQVLQAKIGTSVSLLIRPAVNASEIDAIASGPLLLIEESSIPARVPSNMAITGIRVNLVWALAARTALFQNLTTECPTRTADFEALLEQMHVLMPERFPWFESLFSAHTALQFERVFRGDNPTLPWPQRKKGRFPSLDFLQQSMDRKLLNPLSIEADEGLAFDVFEAGDAAFSSMWVPDEVVPLTVGGERNIPDARFLPFPGPNGPSLCPRVRFALWARVGAFPIDPEVPPLVLPPRLASGTRFLDVAQPTDLDWIQHFASAYYDRLIAGEP